MRLRAVTWQVVGRQQVNHRLVPVGPLLNLSLNANTETCQIVLPTIILPTLQADSRQNNGRQNDTQVATRRIALKSHWELGLHWNATHCVNAPTSVCRNCAVLVTSLLALTR